MTEQEATESVKVLLNKPFSKGYSEGMNDALKSMDELREQNATLRAAVSEMQRMLPVLERLEGLCEAEWAFATQGTGVATANAYRQKLEAALAKMNEK